MPQMLFLCLGAQNNSMVVFARAIVLTILFHALVMSMTRMYYFCFLSTCILLKLGTDFSKKAFPGAHAQRHEVPKNPPPLQPALASRVLGD